MGLTILDLEQEQKVGPVYVLNNMRNLPNQQGNVVFSVLSGNKDRTVTVPETWLPVDLNKFIARKDLLASSEFRSVLAKRWIKLISDEEAQELLEREGAAEEYQRLENLSNSYAADQSMTAVSGNDARRIRAQDSSSDWDTEQKVLDEAATANDVEIGRVMLEEVVANLQDSGTNGLTEVAALNKLRVIANSRLSKDNLLYVFKSTKKIAPKVAAWAKEKAEELGFKKQ